MTTGSDVRGVTQTASVRPPIRGAHFPAIALVILGFALGSFAIGQLIGDPLTLYAEQRSEKLALLAHHQEDSCSAAFGSSHIHNGFDPRVFDQTLGRHAIPVHSLNLAIEGGSQTEQFAMAKWFLAESQRARGGGDCLIVLEATAGANLQVRHLVHPRSINIYDASTADLSLSFSGTGLSWFRRLGRSAFTVAATSMHYLNVGMLASRVFPHENKRDLLDRETEFDRRGLLIEPPDAADTAGVTEAFQARPAAPRMVQATLMSGLPVLVTRLEQSPGGRGVDYVFLVAPLLANLERVEEYPDSVCVRDRRIDVINVARPPEFPDLYRPENWHDVSHLNEAGAAVFSRLVAEEIARRKAQSLTPAACNAGQPTASANATATGTDTG